MLADLYDYVSLLFSCWPTVEARITAVNFRYEEGLFVLYEFSIGDDGPYTGESRFLRRSSNDAVDMREKWKVGQPIGGRYGRDDPSVNRMDPGRLRDFDNL